MEGAIISPGVGSVDRNARIDNISAATCPMIANAAAALRREFDSNKIDSDAASGTVGISQRLVTIQEVIL